LWLYLHRITFLPVNPTWTIATIQRQSYVYSAKHWGHASSLGIYHGFISSSSKLNAGTVLLIRHIILPAQSLTIHHNKILNGTVM
jgi:hypothetical protein